MDRRFTAIRTVAQVVAEQAAHFLDLPPGSERFLRAAALTLTGGVAETVLAWVEGGVELTRDELIELSIQVMLGFGEQAPAIAARVVDGPDAQS